MQAKLLVVLRRMGYNFRTFLGPEFYGQDSSLNLLLGKEAILWDR